MTMGISIISRGDFSKTEKFLKQSMGRNYLDILDEYGRYGVEALSANTPVDTGLTAASWEYEIVTDKNTASIIWKNTNIQNGVNIALILQYGHATRNGYFIEGRDYINPAIQPILDSLAERAWREVSNV